MKTVSVGDLIAALSGYPVEMPVVIPNSICGSWADAVVSVSVTVPNGGSYFGVECVLLSDYEEGEKA